MPVDQNDCPMSTGAAGLVAIAVDGKQMFDKLSSSRLLKSKFPDSISISRGACPPLRSHPGTVWAGIASLLFVVEPPCWLNCHWRVSVHTQMLVKELKVKTVQGHSYNSLVVEKQKRRY